jgi:hypothetical protein
MLTQDLATVVVQPQHQAHLDQYGNVVMAVPSPRDCVGGGVPV